MSDSPHIMETTAPEVRVFTMLPLEPADPNHSAWDWIHCLTFPLDTLNQLHFSSNPYKWIRYATGVVIGAQGELSFSRDLPHDVVEYNQALPTQSTDLYYHTSEAERQRMFPIDPDMDRMTITSSNATSRRENFRSDLVDRDSACVLTGFPEYNCDAVHLLPHCKGSYIETYTQHRSRDADGDDILEDIDDIRNGILLNRIAHHNMGKTFAFLMTPNFAMSTADVDPDAPPTERRCTAHLFYPERPTDFGVLAISSGASVRMPNPADEWPPNIIFDAVYALVVLRRFAPRTIAELFRKWKPAFYPGGTGNVTQAQHQAIMDEQTAHAERRKEQNHARDQRAAKRAELRASRAADDIDYFDCLMFFPYIMVPPEKREEIRREAAKKRAERERSRVEGKVVDWAKGVANACQ